MDHRYSFRPRARMPAAAVAPPSTDARPPTTKKDIDADTDTNGGVGNIKAGQ
jgi:hypothetical protein